MRKAVLFDSFAFQCPFFNGETDINNGFGCEHPQNEAEVDEEISRCYCFKCPLGIEAEQEDLTDKENPNAVKDEIDWDGLCECGEITDGEYLLVNIGETQTEDEKNALYSYERYTHRYDKNWIDSKSEVAP